MDRWLVEDRAMVALPRRERFPHSGLRTSVVFTHKFGNGPGYGLAVVVTRPACSTSGVIPDPLTNRVAAGNGWQLF